MALLSTVIYLLMLSTPFAVAAWFILWFPLQAFKRQHMTKEECQAVESRGDMNAIFRAAFLYDGAMQTDPVIRKLRFWRRVLFFWPFAVFAMAAVAFNFILP